MSSSAPRRVESASETMESTASRNTSFWRKLDWSTWVLGAVMLPILVMAQMKIRIELGGIPLSEPIHRWMRIAGMLAPGATIGFMLFQHHFLLSRGKPTGIATKIVTVFPLGPYWWGFYLYFYSLAVCVPALVAMGELQTAVFAASNPIVIAALIWWLSRGKRKAIVRCLIVTSILFALASLARVFVSGKASLLIWPYNQGLITGVPGVRAPAATPKP